MSITKWGRRRRPLQGVVALAALVCASADAQEAPAVDVVAATPAVAAEGPTPASDVGPSAAQPAVSSSEPLSAAPSAAALEPSATQEEPATSMLPADTTSGWGDLSTLATEEEAPPIFRAKLYGFIDSHLEKVARTPDSVGADGRTRKVFNPYEIDIPNLSIMLQGAIYDKYRFFLNLSSPGSGSNIDDEPVVVRNAWVEAPIFRSYVNLRFGKTYRRFGLYNEILDAVPTFIGIEAPELFDKDHLIVTRTTNIMVHGAIDAGPALINYSVSTGQEERAKKAVPIGADLNVELPRGVKLGTSFYTTGGKALPSRDIGDGSPRGGVVNWMTHDEFVVAGGYAQLKQWNFILQAEFWVAKHEGTRDAAKVAALADAGLNPAQRARFFTNGDPLLAPRTNADYTIRTGYVRTGYEFAIGERMALTPYAQFDYYSNPETINNKDFGGDNEAGLSDDGHFEKYTAGLVFRPEAQVALKVDSSGHRQKFNGKSEFYPELRISLSYLWELPQ